jgi:hypothetical protein
LARNGIFFNGKRDLERGKMASKMPAAREAGGNTVTIADAQQGRSTKPLRCIRCEALVSFVDAHIRQVGDDPVAVEAFFRLNPKQRHAAQCTYNVAGQITTIVRESDASIEGLFQALAGNRFEIRLLAVKKSINELTQLTRDKQLTDNDTPIGHTDRLHTPAEKKLGAYINSAMRVLKVRAALEEHTEIESTLQLVFDGMRLPWRDFYSEYDDYFRCHHAVTDATHPYPMAVLGTVKSIRPVKTDRVMNLVSPIRKTERADVLDSANLSIWLVDSNFFAKFREGQTLLAFGLWQTQATVMSDNHKQGNKIKQFRNFKLSLWPVVGSQLCEVKI